jgi:hypothetical protein
MTARELLRGTAGVAPSLYDEFLGPMLLLLMFAPGEALSAAAALDVLYTYVLAHQPDFDVRWCRGTVRVPRPLTLNLRIGQALTLALAF